jgi:predicted aminopeptidase
MKSNIRSKTVIGAILLLSLLTSGCSISYLFQAAKGQYRLLNESIPVTDALNSSALPDEQKERLRLVAAIKEFGEKELGMKITMNYETVFLSSDRPPIYTISASPKDKLELITWWFPVVGDMPYLGFFEKEAAEKEMRSLKEKGLDTILGEGYAYSTLGWFKDPVNKNLLEGTTVELVETILHEMTHTTIYIKGQGEFNEGIANLAGKTGAFYFFNKLFGPAHPFTIEAEKILKDERIFSSFISSLFNELCQLYNSQVSYDDKLDGREKIFKSSIMEFSNLKNKFETCYYDYFGNNGINNAYLMSIALYHKNFQIFEQFLELNHGSIKKMLFSVKEWESSDGDLLEKIGRSLFFKNRPEA